MSFGKCLKEHGLVYLYKKSFIFLKKRKKEKKKKGYTYNHTAHCLAQNILLWWISPHFVIFMNFGRGARRMIGIQRKPLLNVTFGGVLRKSYSKFDERTIFYLLCFSVESPWIQWLGPVVWSNV